MAASVSAVMRECNHYFVGSFLDATFAIQDNTIETVAGIRLEDIALTGQYVAISGSILNDDVYFVKDDFTLDGVQDETFKGRLHLLRPPRGFLELCEEISEFEAKTPVSAVVSESFGNYSHNKATGINGAVLSWKEAFAAQLHSYRRMFSDLEVL